MKKEIVNRIKQLGGNVANVKGVSLQEDLCAITFNTALYQKPEDTPWLSAEKSVLSHFPVLYRQSCEKYSIR